MAKPSKYKKMADLKQTITEAFADCQLKLTSENYKITGYDNPTKVSASGRTYRTYKVQLEDCIWLSTQSFNQYVKRGYFGNRFNKRLQRAREFARFNESINNEFEPVVKPVEVKEEPKIKQVFELVLSTRKVEEPVEVVEPIDELHDLKTTYNLRQLKGAYRKLSMKHHPDHGGDVEQFKLVKTIYDVRKLMIEDILEVFGYDDPNFAELVDMTEDLHKSMHNIQY